MRKNRGGFTLIELLVVIGIIATLSTVIIISISPAELLRGVRDSNRLAELASINKAVSLIATEKPPPSLGDPTKIYLSLPDDSSSVCGSYTSLPSPTPGYSYNCATTRISERTTGADGFRLISGHFRREYFFQSFRWIT
ncbi:MAG: type II secretion system protein [Patescibacteria group bacterium]